MAISFDGVDDVITWGDINALDSLTQLTMSFLLYIDSTDTSDFSGIIHKYTESGSGQSGWGIVQQSGTSDFIMFARNSDASNAVGGGYSTNTWQHWWWVYDGTQGTNSNRIKLWRNASSQSLSFNGTTATSLPSITDALVMMRNGTAFTKGRLAEVGIWPGVAITDAAIISAAANNYSPLFWKSLGLGFYMRGIRQIQDEVGAASPSTTGTTVVDHVRAIYPWGAQTIFTPAAAASGQPPRSMHQFQMRRAA